MILRIKVFIYQRTGIYLAHMEELRYIKSESFWKQFWEIEDSENNDLSARDIQGLLIGSWQCGNGFYRAFRR